LTRRGSRPWKRSSRRRCSSGSTRRIVPRSKPSAAKSSSDSSTKISTMALPSPQRWNSFMENVLAPRAGRGSVAGRVGRVGGLARAAQHGPALDQRQGDALLDDLVLLVEDLPLPGDDAAAAARPRILLDHLAAHAHRVADEDGPAEVPLADAQH